MAPSFFCRRSRRRSYQHRSRRPERNARRIRAAKRPRVRRMRRDEGNRLMNTINRDSARQRDGRDLVAILAAL